MRKITWGNCLTKYEDLHGRKNSKDPESDLTVNRNNVTSKYANRNVSLKKLFCMHTNADCLINKLNKLKSVIDSCDAHHQLIGVCEINLQNFCFAASTTKFLCMAILCSILMLTQKMGYILTATPIVLCDEFC